MTVATITHAEFLERCKAQGVEPRHWAFKCPVCGTVQSPDSLLRAGVKSDDVDRYIGFSCIGRFTGAGEHRQGTPPGRGCNWTLGGLFQIHKLEVEFPDGTRRRCFEIASPEEAQALRAAQLALPAEASDA